MPPVAGPGGEAAGVRAVEEEVLKQSVLETDFAVFAAEYGHAGGKTAKGAPAQGRAAAQGEEHDNQGREDGSPEEVTEAVVVCEPLGDDGEDTEGTGAGGGTEGEAGGGAGQGGQREVGLA